MPAFPAILRAARGALALTWLASVASCIDWSSLYGPRCGDGNVDPGEACDDGNALDGDRCTAQCQLPAPFCGDGHVDSDEECDDGNQDDDDACLTTCKSASCGDGHTEAGVEQCDDDNLEPGDGCSPGCQIEPPTCGNGMLDPGEPCDDGNDSNQDSCLRGCSHAVCGDGFVRTGVEECDYGIAGSINCTHGCQVCPSDAKSYSRGNTHCYEYHSEPLSYAAARAVCAKKDGYVWTIVGALEASDVLSHLTAATLDTWLSLDTSVSPYAWVTGEATKYQAWAAGQPSDAALGCALNHEDPMLGSQWQSAACTDKHAYVCERNTLNEDAVSHHAYRLRTDPLPFTAASDACVALGGHLLTLESMAEQVQLGKWFSLDLWLGATRVPGGFQWVTGQPVSAPTFYAKGQPDDASGNEDCLALGKAHFWSDVACDAAREFVCELE